MEQGQGSLEDERPPTIDVDFLMGYFTLLL